MEDHEFEASVGYITEPCLGRKKTKKKRISFIYVTDKDIQGAVNALYESHVLTTSK